MLGYVVYTLADPRNGNIRYVGQSSNVYSRFAQHMLDRNNRSKHSWIKSLKQQGLIPELIILEEGIETRGEAYCKEYYWVSFYTNSGANLTNTSRSAFAKSRRNSFRIGKSKCRLDKLGVIRHTSGISLLKMYRRLEGITSRRYISIEKGGPITDELAAHILEVLNTLLAEIGKPLVTFEDLGLVLY